MIQNTYRLWLLIFFIQLTFTSVAKESVFTNSANYNVDIGAEVFEKTLENLTYYDSIQQEDSIKHYIFEAKTLVSKIDTSSGYSNKIIQFTAEIYSVIAYHYFKKKQFSDAIVDFTHAQGLFHYLNDKKSLATCLNNKAVIYMNTGNKAEALQNFQKTVALFIELKDSLGIIIGYNNLSKIYRQQDDFLRAQNNLEHALIIAREIDNPNYLSRTLNAMAGLKKDLGELDAALTLYQEALSLTKSAGNELLTAQVLNNIGVIYLETKEFVKAKEFLERSYELVNKNNYQEGKAFALKSLSKYYYATNNPKKAIELSEESLAIGNQTNNDQLKTESTELLLEIFESQNNWEKAFFYQGLLIDQNNKHEKSAIELITQQETIRLKLENDRFIAINHKAEQALVLEQKTQRQNTYYIVFGVIFLLLITALLIIYFRLRASREKNKYITKQSEERKLLLQEVHHRVKNNFQIVSSMLRLQSYNFDNEELRLNFEEAVNRINAMAIVHDVIYRQEKFKDINSKTYLEKLVLSLHKTGDSRIFIDVESEEIPFKIETLINIGIALNELITNSFKHAFNQTITQPKIEITFRTIGDKMYELNYKDNGIGIDKDSYSSNFGMELIETIIDNFEGEVQLIDDLMWNTSIRITFKEF